MNVRRFFFLHAPIHVTYTETKVITCFHADAVS